MTSDHSVAGSSPAGCKTATSADYQVILSTHQPEDKTVVIGLLSVFETHDDRISSHVRIIPRGFGLAYTRRGGTIEGAYENCPFSPTPKKVNWIPFPDPILEIGDQHRSQLDRRRTHASIKA